MNLYILRHASAGVRRASPSLDIKRPLDKEGKEQCLLVGRYLNAMRIQFDLIVSSPLKRALQTASLVGTEVAYDSKIQVSEALSPAGTIADFQKLIATLSTYENVLVVGHNPNLPQFVGALICAPRQASVRMRKGAIARLDCTPRSGQLLSLVDTRMLRQVYASATKSSRRKTSRK
jgi:phosphohistidine phosphatase